MHRARAAYSAPAPRHLSASRVASSLSMASHSPSLASTSTRLAAGGGQGLACGGDTSPRPIQPCSPPPHPHPPTPHPLAAARPTQLQRTFRDHVLPDFGVGDDELLHHAVAKRSADRQNAADPPGARPHHRATGACSQGCSAVQPRQSEHLCWQCCGPYAQHAPHATAIARCTLVPTAAQGGRQAAAVSRTLDAPPLVGPVGLVVFGQRLRPGVYRDDRSAGRQLGRQATQPLVAQPLTWTLAGGCKQQQQQQRQPTVGSPSSQDDSPQQQPAA